MPAKPFDISAASIPDDKLSGIEPIAAFIGEPIKPHLLPLRARTDPVGKIGARWVGSKRVLWAHFEKITGAQHDSPHNRPERRAATKKCPGGNRGNPLGEASNKHKR